MREPSVNTVLPTQPRRGPSAGRALTLLMLASISWMAGCASMGTTGALKADTSKEPYLLLRLSERRLYLKDGQQTEPPGGYPVAIGKARFPTPTGRFQINEMVENPDFLMFDFNDTSRPNRGRIPPGINNPLGLRWIGFAHAHGWAVGFHGTSKTQFLGQAVSHGCVRMRNDDIVKVFARVKLGTPVVVEP